MFGAQSMTGPLRSVFVRPPGAVSSATLEALGWSPAQSTTLRGEYLGFKRLLESLSIEVLEGAPAPDDNPDAIYCFDPLLLTREGSLLLDSGKDNRRAEATIMARELETFGIPIFGSLGEPARADGGDLLWLTDKQLAVGLGWRTNAAAVARLKELLEPLGVEVLAFDLPNYRGSNACLHLMSLVSLLDEHTALAWIPMLPVRLVLWFNDHEVELLNAPAWELETLGANVLSIGERRLVAVEGNPETRSLLESQGFEVFTYEGEHLSLAGTGGPTCLTRPLWRG
ncbi:MAG: hypothetical protein AUK47_19995 [Deltaproteobacteria bacterium CG2_30_63_29]|nr:MAG: hypothetical protein AUK47_19995 [Deltaproteobacteria bacterium CG2_30_63_29]